MILPRPNSLMQWGFGWACHWGLKRRFAGVWIDRESAFGLNHHWPAEGCFFYSTHSSWCDPLVSGEILYRKMKVKRAFAPMQFSQLKHHWILRSVGVFGVEPGNGPEVQSWVRDQRSRDPNSTFWVHPQGQFAPNEIAQPEFRQGLARWSKNALRIPVVIHYQWASEQKPIVFLRIGSPVDCDSDDVSQDSENLRTRLNQEVRSLLPKVYQAVSGHRFSPSDFEKWI